MSRLHRMILFFVGAAGLGLLYVSAFIHLPGPLHLRDRYARAINGLAVDQRHITDAVTAVNFDYRGFDTLGEEFILFASVMGTLVLLRQEGEKPATGFNDAVTPLRDVEHSNALHVWTLGMTGPTVLFGLYMVAHGQVSPGGGFQGGVVLATAPLLIYLAENFDVFKRVTSHRLIEITEATGAGLYVLVGMIAWFYGREYLTNVLPLGTSGKVMSGGTVFAINAATGLEVTAGFVLLLYAFLQETMQQEGGQK